MFTVNRICSATRRSQRLALPAIACLVLCWAQPAEAAGPAQRPAPALRPTGLSVKSFGPAATNQALRFCFWIRLTP